MSQRRRYTDEDKARLLAEFATTGGSAAAFCRQRRIGYHPFMQWRRRAAGETSKAGPFPGFVEIDLPPRNEPIHGGALVELDFGGGLVLRIRPLHPQSLSRP